MDVAYPLMVVGTAERHIQVFNLQNPTTPFKVSCSSKFDLPPVSFFYVVLDPFISTQVANSCRLLLPQRKRFCRR